MNKVTINNFDDAILHELQKKLWGMDAQYASLTFHELWTAAAAASETFWAPVNSVTQRKEFTARLMEALTILTKCEFIAVDTNASDNIESVRLLPDGLVHIKQIKYYFRQQ